MRFVLAIVLLVAAFVCIGVGVAQRTIWALPDHVTLSATTSSRAPVTVIEGSVLRSLPGTQTIRISGRGDITAAYGRTSDVLAWVEGARYNRIGFDKQRRALTQRVVPGDETSVPPLSGSDLWLKDYAGQDELSIVVNLPKEDSMIIASDGTSPAPSGLSVTWPLDDSRPLALPLVFAGLGLLLVGLGVLVWALLHVRRTRGPRRRYPRAPRPPRAVRYRSRPKAVTGARGAIRPIVAASAVVLGLGVAAPVAASADPTPSAGAAVSSAASGPSADIPTPAKAAGAKAAEKGKKRADQPPTAVTESQLRKIVDRTSETVAKADAARDLDLASTRLDGPALEFRKASYAIRGVDGSLGALPAIPDGRIRLALPQQSDTWPRSVLAVVEDAKDPNAAPTALVLIQNDPRSPYKVHYAVTLEPKAQIPDVAPASVGAARLPDDIKLLTVPPGDLANDYADVLLHGTDSQYASLFDLDHDGLVPQIGADKKNERKAGMPATATIDFADSKGDGQNVAFATNDSGGLVAVSVDDSETVKPAQAGAAVNPTNSVKALSGKDASTKGITATYGVQLLFYVPPVSDGGKVVLLGYSNALISASELP